MNRVFLRPFLQWFTDYVGGFAQADPSHQYNIEIKRKHSFRVLENAVAILDSINISEEESQAALIAALLHDVGRFLQYATYRTFNDTVSVNHAVLGCTILNKVPLMEPVTPFQRVAVRTAVAVHNRKYLPRNMRAGLADVCRVVRDADKLDILSVVLSHLDPDGPKSKTVTLGLKSDPNRYSSRIYEQVQSGSMASYEYMQWENDFSLLLLSWIFDLNFQESFALFLSRNYLESIFGLLPDTPEFHTLYQRVQEYIVDKTGMG